MTHKQWTHTQQLQRLRHSAGSCPVVVGAETAAAVLHFGAVHPCGAETRCRHLFLLLLAPLQHNVCAKAYSCGNQPSWMSQRQPSTFHSFGTTPPARCLLHPLGPPCGLFLFSLLNVWKVLLNRMFQQVYISVICLFSLNKLSSAVSMFFTRH